MSWWDIIKADKNYYDMIWDLEGRLSDGDAKRTLAAVLAKGQDNENLVLHVMNPNAHIPKWQGDGFDIAGGVVDPTLTPDELRELNRLGDRVRAGLPLNRQERERYEELLNEGGAVMNRHSAETGEESYHHPIAISVNDMYFMMKVIENNGVYDALFYEIGDEPTIMGSRKISDSIREMLAQMD